jgi:hypothetical protein
MLRINCNPYPLLAKGIAIVAVSLLASGCANSKQAPTVESMTDLAEEFIHLGLQAQNHDKLEYLYFGPEQWRTAAQEKPLSLTQIQTKLTALSQRIKALPNADDEMESKRRALLLDRITAMVVRADVLQQKFPASFDEESRQLFGVTAPHYDENHFRALADELNEIIPGEGALPERIQRFRDQFIIPADKVETAITAAVQECRKRTKAQIDLPDNESVSLNITSGKHWVGFAEYKGNSQTTIHINTGVPIHVERVLQLGCHEGYPGHHVHASLMEQELVKKKGWIEYTFVPLNGSTATVAEGAANYGVDLAFSRDERIEFEKAVVLPIAGLKGDQLDLYYRYFDLLDRLNFARNEVARLHLFGGMPKDEAIQWLMEFGLESVGTATQRLNFIQALRTYVINYNYGKTLVKGYVESYSDQGKEAMWEAFEEVLSTPITPQDMLDRVAEKRPK